MRVDDEEDGVMGHGQEAMVGDTESQTVLIGDTESQTIVISGFAGNSNASDSRDGQTTASTGPSDSIFSRGVANVEDPKVVVRERSTTASSQSLQGNSIHSRMMEEATDLYSEDVLMIEPVTNSPGETTELYREDEVEPATKSLDVYGDASPKLVPILTSVPEETSYQYSSTSSTPVNSAPTTKSETDEELGKPSTDCERRGVSSRQCPR